MLRHTDYDCLLVALDVGIAHSHLPGSVAVDTSDQDFTVIERIQLGKGLPGNERIRGCYNFNHFRIKPVKMRHRKQFATANELLYLITG